MFGKMLQAKGVTVDYKLAQQDARRTEAQVCSVMRSAFHRPSPDGVNIIYFSGHGVAARVKSPGTGSQLAPCAYWVRAKAASGARKAAEEHGYSLAALGGVHCRGEEPGQPGVAGSDDTRGALHIGRSPDPEVRDLPLSQLRAQTRHLELRGHRGRKRTYIEALQRRHLLKLDDCLTVWAEVGGAARGSRLLIVADSCYSGKLISRIRGLPPVELAQLNVGIQSAGNARQTVGQASGFSHGGRSFESSGCLTAYLTAKQEEGARVRWSWPGQHPQFFCTWDPAAAERPSVELELGGGHTFRTYSQPQHR
jgi:hypothetical protein